MLQFPKDKYKMDYLRFYEGGAEPTEKEDRVYQEEFIQDETRCVYWEAGLSYAPLDESRHLLLEVTVYQPDGMILGVDQLEEELEAGTDFYWLSSGFGYSERGLLYPGEYRTEVSVNGKRIFEGEFYIKANHDFLKNVVAEPLLLYRGDYDQEPPEGERTYQTEFSRLDTQYIYWEVRLTYPQLLEKKWVKFQYVFYSPDETVMDTDYYAVELEQHSHQSVHSMGIGYDQPGDWEMGNYRLEVYLNGELIGEKPFVILKDNMFLFPTVKVDSLTFYEGGLQSPPMEERVYQVAFSKNLARFINWQLELSFPTVQKDRTIQLEHEYLMEDGTSLGIGELSVPLQKGWNSACINLGRGTSEPGLWIKGRYMVRLTIDGKLKVEEWFEIV
jgi:hypothetical protein